MNQIISYENDAMLSIIDLKKFETILKSECEF